MSLFCYCRRSLQLTSYNLKCDKEPLNSRLGPPDYHPQTLNCPEETLNRDYVQSDYRETVDGLRQSENATEQSMSLGLKNGRLGKYMEYSLKVHNWLRLGSFLIKGHVGKSLEVFLTRVDSLRQNVPSVTDLGLAPRQIKKVGILVGGALDYESFRDVDMVIEADIEELVYIPPLRQLLLLLLLVLILQEQLGAGLVQMLSQFHTRRRRSGIGVLKKKAKNASGKYTRSLKKRGKRRIDYRVPSVSIEDARDAKEENYSNGQADAWSNLASAYMRKGRLTEATLCRTLLVGIEVRLTGCSVKGSALIEIFHGHHPLCNELEVVDTPIMGFAKDEHPVLKKCE
nr:mediator of RNA polymerase II transcription subunit 12 [Ipomoea batatas]